MSNGDVLIVIPAKNEGMHIKSCLEAVCEQDYDRNSVTIVVVDNGSTDDTIEKIRDFQGINLLTKAHGTISSVRNIGATFIQSKYIAFLDGDCVPPKSWLSQGIELLQEKDVSCVGFPSSPPAENDSWVAKTWHLMSSSAKHSGTCDVRWLSSFNLILKRIYFEQIGGFDESLETCEDADFGAKLARVSRLTCSDKLNVRHLGVVHTLKDFFHKEMWRGKSNWSHFKKSTDKKKDSISVFVPLIYILFSVILSGLSLFKPALISTTVLFVVFLPLAFSLKKIRTWRAMKRLPAMIILAAVYLCARGLALLQAATR